MDKKGGLGFNSGFQFNYALPWNLSQFEPTVVHARSTRQAAMDTALNVDNVYLAIEELLEEWVRNCLYCEKKKKRNNNSIHHELRKCLYTPIVLLLDYPSGISILPAEKCKNNLLRVPW